MQMSIIYFSLQDSQELFLQALDWTKKWLQDFQNNLIFEVPWYL